MSTRAAYTSAESWLQGRVGEVPATSLGWFRAGVGFYNKREFQFSIECLQKSVQMDPLNVRAQMRTIRGREQRSARIQALTDCVCAVPCLLVCSQYNAFQIMARACIAVNRTSAADRSKAQDQLSGVCLCLVVSLLISSHSLCAVCIPGVVQVVTMPSRR